MRSSLLAKLLLIVSLLLIATIALSSCMAEGSLFPPVEGGENSGGENTKAPDNNDGGNTDGGSGAVGALDGYTPDELIVMEGDYPTDDENKEVTSEKNDKKEKTETTGEQKPHEQKHAQEGGNNEKK